MDCACRDLPLLLFGGGSFLSSGRLPAMDQAGNFFVFSAPLSGTFLGLALDLRSDKLYDLVQDIPDVMGLQTLRPSAAIVKVISVPDSRCIRVMTPDDHIKIGFHEVLLHDMEDEDLPFVALNELNCLHLDWPKTCPDISVIWSGCGKTAENALDVRSREIVLIVENIFSRI